MSREWKVESVQDIGDVKGVEIVVSLTDYTDGPQGRTVNARSTLPVYCSITHPHSVSCAKSRLAVPVEQGHRDDQGNAIFKTGSQIIVENLNKKLSRPVKVDLTPKSGRVFEM